MRLGVIAWTLAACAVILARKNNAESQDDPTTTTTTANDYGEDAMEVGKARRQVRGAGMSFIQRRIAHALELLLNPAGKLNLRRDIIASAFAPRRRGEGGAVRRKKN